MPDSQSLPVSEPVYSELASAFARDYHTPQPAPTLALARSFPGLVFYWKLANLVLRAGRLANRHIYPAPAWAASSSEVGRLVEGIGGSLHIEGTENITALPGPCVFVANHMSTLETFLLPAIIQPLKDVTFVVKESLVKYPWLGAVLSSRNPITIGRANPREDLSAVLEGGQALLAQGCSIIIFSQGTRSNTVDPAHFGSMGVKLARKAQVPVMPIALKTDIWGSGRLIKDFGPVTPSIPVHLKFGPALTVEGNGKAEHAAIVDFIVQNFQSWQNTK